MSPEPIGQFLEKWRHEHEAKPYILTDPAEQEAFLEAAASLLRFLAHTAHSVAIYTVPEGKSVSSVFIRVTQ